MDFVNPNIERLITFTTHEWINAIRTRPAMYLGNRGRHSLAVLASFMSALQLTRCPDPEPSYGGFVCWAADRISSTLPWDSLVGELGDGAAFERFFELYDEYRKCQRVYMLRAVLHDHVANFTTGTADRPPELPQRPLELIISQFAPSKAYEVIELYLDHTAGQFSFFPSLRAAKANALQMWNVRAKEWLPISDRCTRHIQPA